MKKRKTLQFLIILTCIVGKYFNTIEAWYSLDHIDNNMHQVNNIPQGQLNVHVGWRYIILQCIFLSVAFLKTRYRYTKLPIWSSLAVLFATCNIIEALSLFLYAQAGIRINQKYMRFILLELVGLIFFLAVHLTQWMLERKRVSVYNEDEQYKLYKNGEQK